MPEWRNDRCDFKAILRPTNYYTGLAIPNPCPIEYSSDDPMDCEGTLQCRTCGGLGREHDSYGRCQGEDGRFVRIERVTRGDDERSGMFSFPKPFSLDNSAAESATEARAQALSDVVEFHDLVMNAEVDPRTSYAGGF